jgi:hypothetical protein
MKKIMLVISIAFCATAAYTQVKFGIKAGYNLTNFIYTGNLSTGSYKAKSDFNAGVLLSIPLFNTFYLQPEIIYSGQGAGYTFNPNPQIEVFLKYNYNYLNAPLLFKYQYVAGFFAETGPQLGFLLSADAKGVNVDEKAYSEPLDFSWVFGLGYKIPNINLGIDARYNLGLTEVNTNSSVGSIRNSVFQFGVFYLVGKK